MIGTMSRKIPGIAAAFLAAAAESPSVPAVRDSGGEWTYRDLAEHSRRLATAMALRGVTRGDRVVLAMSRGSEAVAAMLATAMAGAAYVPIDPDAPRRYVEMLADRAHASLVVTDGTHQGGEQWATVRQLTAQAGAMGSVADQGPGSDIAYCVFTSGSTGAPKCVEVTNAGLLNLLRQVDAHADCSDGLNGTWWTSPAFDVSAWEVWSVLTRGGTLSVVPQDVRLEGARLAQWLRENRLTSAYIPPMMLADLRDHAARCPDGWALRRLLVGVEPIRLGLLQEIMAILPGLRIINGYGPAETTVCCTLFPVPREGGNPLDRCPIGSAIPGNRVFIIGDDDRPSSEGELYVAGAGLARGYLHDPAQTAARFTQLPGGYGRAYRTGDIVRKCPDGNLLFIGRADRQLKIRGYRVEASAVESVLSAHPAVRECVVAVRGTPDWGALLTAYVIPEPGQPVDQSELIRFAAGQLPAFATPSLVLTVTEMPQTQNGKIDYDALAATPLPARPAPEPREATGDASASLAAQVLACVSALVTGSPTMDMSFTELGGTSLTAVIAAGQLRQLLGRDVTVAAVLAAPSLGALADVLPQAPPLTGGVQRAGAASGPLLPQQAGLWLADQGGQGTLDYAEHLWFSVEGPLDTDRLLVALRRALEAHPVFGATVELAPKGKFIQRIGRHRVEPVLVDALLLDPVAIASYVTDFISRPLALLPGPAVRCAVLRHDSAHHTLVIASHHLLLDGWTARLLTRDIGMAYRSGLPPARRTAVTICDLGNAYAERDLDAIQARAAAAAASVEGLSPFLPGRDGRGDRERLSPGSPTGHAATVEISSATQRAVPQLARAMRASPAAIWLAAFGGVINDVLLAGRSVMGIATSGRDELDSHEVAGSLVNTSLVRPPSGDGGSAARIGAAAECLLTAIRFQDIPFPLVARSFLQGCRQRPRRFPPLYFSYDEAAILDLGIGLVATPGKAVLPRSKFDVSLTVEDYGTSVNAVLECRSAAFSAAESSQLAAAIATEITAMTTSVPDPAERTA